ncbi:3,4-dihydroxy-2-butanone-4-phosphate synthase [Motilimonas cestriensis]|uniref:3,4-dihydroxy-2-butanone-4-phosphate synthase n=1 Tax=Motilimonas cestriensis TaxID=2742685 RepID=UPI003DA31ACC
MSQSLLTPFGTPMQRVETALIALQQGQGVLVVDDENRENEGDFIFSAQHLTTAQMAMMIREGSGIVCLCLPEERIKQLVLPQMVSNNTSQNHTAYTVTIEAKEGVTTGVSAADRVTTIKAATAANAKPEDLSRPGHVFPLKAVNGGVLVRRGHTEASVDLMRLAGLDPFGVICELNNIDGSMARLPEVVKFATQHQMPVLSIEDLVSYINSQQSLAG